GGQRRGAQLAGRAWLRCGHGRATDGASDPGQDQASAGGGDPVWRTGRAWWRGARRHQGWRTQLRVRDDGGGCLIEWLLGLTGAVGNAALAQVIRRQLNAHLVTSENADVVLAHLAGDVRGNDVPVFQLHAEHGVGQGVDDSAFHFEAVFFRHAVKPSVSRKWPGATGARQKRRALCPKTGGCAKGLGLSSWMD